MRFRISRYELSRLKEHGKYRGMEVVRAVDKTTMIIRVTGTNKTVAVGV